MVNMDWFCCEKIIALGILAHLLRIVMEPKYYAEEVIGHPPIIIWEYDWIQRVVFDLKKNPQLHRIDFFPIESWYRTTRGRISLPPMYLEEFIQRFVTYSKYMGGSSYLQFLHFGGIYPYNASNGFL